MAIRKISEFVSALPTSADKILFEHNEKGKSCSIGDAVNTCSLTLEEIQATTDLTGKIASASSLKELSTNVTHIENAIYLGKSPESNDFSFIPRNVGTGVYVVFSDKGVRVLGILHINEEGYGLLHVQSNYEVAWSGGSLDDTVTIYVGAWYNHVYARRIA